MHTIKKALVLDLDGTVRRSKSGKEFVDSLDDIELIPGMEERIMLFKGAGYLVLGFTNQGWVAFGYKSSQMAFDESSYTKALFKTNPFEEIAYRFHHEEGSVRPHNIRSLMRKPDIGMLAVLEDEFYLHRGTLIDWDNSLFVGDRAEDAECARRAGIPFQDASAFVNTPVSIFFQKLNGALNSADESRIE